MTWRRRTERTPRFRGLGRALWSLPVRRAVALGGFTLVAWVLGATAPAFADTLGTLTEVALVPERAGAQQPVEIADLTGTVQDVLTPDDSAAPAPPVDLPRAVGLGPLLDPVAADPSPATPTGPRSGSPETGRAPAEAPGTPDTSPRRSPESGEAGSGAAPAASPALDPTASEPDATAAPPADPGTEPSATAASAPPQPAQAQQQGPSFPGALVGYLPRPPAAPRRDALTATVGPTAAFPTRQHAADPSFSPD